MGHNENFIPEPAQIMAFGIVNAVPKRSSTKVVFTTTPSQYVLGLKDYASSPRQAFPMRCKIDLTLPRYKKTDGNSWAPDVKLNGRTLFHGSITRIVRKLKSDTAQISYVKISVNDVVYSMGSNQATPIKIEPGKKSIINFFLRLILYKLYRNESCEQRERASYNVPFEVFIPYKKHTHATKYFCRGRKFVSFDIRLFITSFVTSL